MVSRVSTWIVFTVWSTSTIVSSAQDTVPETLPVVGQVDVEPAESESEFRRWERVLRRQTEPSVYDEPLETDRPDFTEASSVVGRGVLQIESGYTFTSDDEGGTRSRSHSAPESLFRYGVSDNVELRLVWNYLWQDTTSAGGREQEDGAEDLVLGTKLALTSQSGWIPEAALILDMTTPTGGTGITNQLTEFGSNFLFGWDLPGDKYLAGSVGYATGTQLADRHNVFHASVTHGIPLAESWNVYFEYFGIFLQGLTGGRPVNYFDTGMTYLINNNLQLDVRLGVGLNSAADDYFVGTGVSVRF